MDWTRSGDHDDILYETAGGIAKITINRPEVRNAFRPQTLFELSAAFDAARDNPKIGVILFTGRAPRPSARAGISGCVETTATRTSMGSDD